MNGATIEAVTSLEGATVNSDGGTCNCLNERPLDQQVAGLRTGLDGFGV